MTPITTSSTAPALPAPALPATAVHGIASGAPTAWVPRRLAAFHQAPPAQPLLRDWLEPSRDALFRWTMGMAASPEGRRAVAEMAVSVQRLRGPREFGVWLYAAALQAALLQGDSLPEPSLAGLPPELRALLRLVARGTVRREEAMAWLAQRMGFVRSRLVHARVASLSAPAPLQDRAAANHYSISLDNED